MANEEPIFPSCYNCVHYMNPHVDDCELELGIEMVDTEVNCLFFDPA